MTVIVNNFGNKLNLKPRLDNEISVVFSADNNYLPYLGVAIQSLIEHSSKDNNYTLYILSEGLLEELKEKLSSLETENIKIQYVDIRAFFENLSDSMFYIHHHFSKAVYYRFFVPEIFSNFKKITYCDCDAVFLEDVANLYNIEIGENLIGAVFDTGARCNLYIGNDENYFSGTLGLKKPFNYVNTGVCIFNIAKCLEFNFTQKCLEKLKEIGKPRCVDQCIINIICEDKIKLIDMSWNVQNQIIMFYYKLKQVLPQEEYSTYLDNIKNPKFLHYTGCIKPWNCLGSYNAKYFWKYAIKTPFFGEIFTKNLGAIIMTPSSPYLYKNYLQMIFSVKKVQTPGRIYRLMTILGIKFLFKTGDK